MKRFLTVILTISLCLGFIPNSVYGSTDIGGSLKEINAKSPLAKVKKEQYVEGEAIILMEDSISEGITTKSKSKTNVGLPSGIEIEDTLIFDDVPDTKTRIMSKDNDTDTGPVVMNVSSDKYSTEELVEILDELPTVKYAEPNYTCEGYATSDNKYFNYQWALENDGQNNGTSGKDLDIDNIWGVTNSGKTSSDTIVAVLDTGVDYTHDDLKDKMWKNENTGKLAGKYGYDFCNYTTDPMDDNGHGTHVAGIIGSAGENNNGTSGVHKGVKIMSLKFLDEEGDGDTYGALSAYEYIDKALSLGYKVKAVNNSWGSNEDESRIFKTIIETIGAKGCISVCAAGNESADNDSIGSFPANIDSPYVISVAATNENGDLASFSNYGNKSVDIGAPGTAILSTVPYDVYNPTIYTDTDKANLSNIYKGFGNSEDLADIKWQNWDGDEWITSGSISASDSAIIKITDEDYFGRSDENGTESLKWTINKLNNDGMYNLYIPYQTTESKVPIQASVAAKLVEGISGGTEYDYGGALIVSDTKLINGRLSDNYKDPMNLIFGENVFALTGADLKMNSWDSLNGNLNEKSQAGKDRAIVFTYIALKEDVNHEILLDDIGISKGGDDNNGLGKYAFYSGTSMATPMVSGSLALLSDAKPSYSPEQLALEISGMTGNDTLNGKVASNGILNLSDYDNAKPHILNAKISGKNVIVNGVEFGNDKGQIKVNGNAVTSSNVTWKNTSITIPAQNVKNKVVNFEIKTASEKTAAATIYVVSGKPGFTNELSMDDTYSGSITTDGKDLYYAGYGGRLSILREVIYDEDEDDFDMFSADNGKIDVKRTPITEKMFVTLAYIDPKKMFPDATASELKNATVGFETELTYLNGYFYAVTSLDTGFSKCYAFSAYNIKKKQWIRISDKPGEENTKDKNKVNQDFKNIQNNSLAAYNGKIYLMGGINPETFEVSNKVQVYNPASKKWSKGPDMPEGRFLGIARQSGDKLVLSIGGNNKSDKSAVVPLIFNGKSWTRGKAIQSPIKNSVLHLPADATDTDTVVEVDPDTEKKSYYKPIEYFNAAVGIVENGLIYSGLPSDSLGDTYSYNINSNTYTASNYQYKDKSSDDELIGIALGSKFYVTALSTIPGYDEDEEEDFDFFDDDDFDIPMSSLDSIPVKSGLIAVTAKKGKCTITGTGKYLPGQKVTIKAKAKKKYYFKKMSINKTSTKKTKYTINAITKKINVVATTAKYKTKVKLNKKKATLKAGKSIKLKAKVTKVANKKKGVKWSVSNKKYAKVTQKGKVTVKKAGKGKTVKIYAKAKDGSGAKAVCKIKIN